MDNRNTPANTWIDALTTEHVKRLRPYESARRLFSASTKSGDANSQVWLNANEAPVADEFRVNSEVFNRYPDCQPEELISAYASYCGLENRQVITTRGADEGIELIIRGFCDAGKDSVLICPPTYGMYAISAQTFNVGVEKAQLKPDFSLDLQAIEQYVDKVKVVFLCSPNNPTGTRLSEDDVIAVLNMFKNKAVVVLDEAYIEFDAEHAKTNLLAQFDNLVILRTLSKAFALAGIRCGFVLSNPIIAKVLMKVIAPYPVPAPVAQIATSALSESGIAHMRNRVQDLQAGMVFITDALQQHGEVEIVGDTKANFVLFRHEANAELMDYLVDHDMIIRNQSKQISLHNCLRITVGSEKENHALIHLINDFFKRKAA
ncbi:histidinol-phosphate transaminase [Ningiella sp. W23]|uniref:histidinol-phosphate transaminase n=1 Tax=Ningiella sp. W23 TaxID=3023715 RepID=UPI00375656CF